MFHCHIVPHSDLGMMGVFEVLAQGQEPTSPATFACRL